MYGQVARLLHPVAVLPPGVAQWLVDRGPKNIGFDFFEEYCARLADFSSEDFADAPGHPRRGRRHHGRADQSRRAARRRVDFAAPFYKIAGTEGAPARFFATV